MSSKNAILKLKGRFKYQSMQMFTNFAIIKHVLNNTNKTIHAGTFVYVYNFCITHFDSACYM